MSEEENVEQSDDDSGHIDVEEDLNEDDNLEDNRYNRNNRMFGPELTLDQQLRSLENRTHDTRERLDNLERILNKHESSLDLILVMLKEAKEARSPARKKAKQNTETPALNVQPSNNGSSSIKPTTATADVPMKDQAVKSTQAAVVETLEQQLRNKLLQQFTTTALWYSTNNMHTNKIPVSSASKQILTQDVQSIIKEAVLKATHIFTDDVHTALQVLHTSERELYDEICNRSGLTVKLWKEAKLTWIVGLGGDRVWNPIREKYNLSDFALNEAALKGLHEDEALITGQANLNKSKSGESPSEKTPKKAKKTKKGNANVTNNLTPPEPLAPSNPVNSTNSIVEPDVTNSNNRGWEKGPTTGNNNSKEFQSPKQKQHKGKSTETLLKEALETITKLTKSPSTDTPAVQNPKPKTNRNEDGTFTDHVGHKRCLRCSSTKHTQADCSVDASLQCNHCKKPGHFYSACLIRRNKMGGHTPKPLSDGKAPPNDPKQSKLNFQKKSAGQQGNE